MIDLGLQRAKYVRGFGSLDHQKHESGLGHMVWQGQAKRHMGDLYVFKYPVSPRRCTIATDRVTDSGWSVWLVAWLIMDEFNFSSFSSFLLGGVR